MYYFKIKTAGCESTCGHHTPSLQALAIVASFAAPRTFLFFRVHHQHLQQLCCPRFKQRDEIARITNDVRLEPV